MFRLWLLGMVGSICRFCRGGCLFDPWGLPANHSCRVAPRAPDRNLERERLEALASPLFVLASIVGVCGEGGTNFDHVISVDADGFVQSLSGDAELLAPVVDVGGDLRVDFVGAAGSVLYVL